MKNYLDELFKDKQNLEIFEKYLSKNVFNGDKIELKKNNGFFYLYINKEKASSCLDDFMHLCHNEGIGKLDNEVDNVDLIVKWNVFMAKLFGEKYEIDSITSFAEHIKTNYGSLTDHIHTRYDVFSLQKEKSFIDKVEYYSEIIYKLGKQYKKLEKADKLNKELNEELTR